MVTCPVFMLFFMCAGSTFVGYKPYYYYYYIIIIIFVTVQKSKGLLCTGVIIMNVQISTKLI